MYICMKLIKHIIFKICQKWDAVDWLSLTRLFRIKFTETYHMPPSWRQRDRSAVYKCHEICHSRNYTLHHLRHKDSLILQQFCNLFLDTNTSHFHPTLLQICKPEFQKHHLTVTKRKIYKFLILNAMLWQRIVKT